MKKPSSPQKLTELTAWATLKKHHTVISKLHMRDLFTQNPQRFAEFSLEAADIFLDYSKNCITKETLDQLIALARQTQLSLHIDRLFNAYPINYTENRAALHTALRNFIYETAPPTQQNIAEQVQKNLHKMAVFCEKLHRGEWQGYHKQPITDVVNIGIGGSDLGPAMVTTALTPYLTSSIRCHFVSNVDGSHISEVLKKLNPNTTLFILSSKSFTTLETLTNANTAKKWLYQATHSTDALQQHFIAISADRVKAIAWGIHPDQIFEQWNWVGGRFSLWAATGLPIAIAIGIENFKALLAGAHTMDQHFRHAPFHNNMPVILALLGIWYTNFFGAKTHAIFPYDHYLKHLPHYLQQLGMESNGKSTTYDGTRVEYTTSPVIWGDVGCNGQHTFHQLLHQGTQLVPADFIIPARNHHSLDSHHEILFANCLGQTQALMRGKTYDEAVAELLRMGFNDTEAKRLAAHKAMSGNRPTNTLVFQQLTPRSLGALLALYEHKTLVQGAIWCINPFDQWGVELGKQLARHILPHLNQQQGSSGDQDGSTEGLIAYYRKVMEKGKSSC